MCASSSSDWSKLPGDSEQGLAAVIQASPLAMVALTPEGNITLWNRAAERLFGWTAREVLGQPLPHIPQDEREEYRRMWDQALTTQGLASQPARRLKKNGTPIAVRISTAAIRDPGGRITGVVSIYEDVTERKAMEDWLHRQAELLEQAHDAMLVWRLDGAIEYWNRAAEELYGYAGGSGQGPVASGQLFLEQLRTHRRWSGELERTTRDGRRITVESRQVLVRTAQGTDVVLESNRDVSERVKAERELRVANEALRRINTDLEQFASAAAHDLQEPLRNIVIFAQLLVRRYGGVMAKDGVDFLQMIGEGARRMQSMMGDLLTYSRSVGGSGPAAPTCDASRILAEVLDGISTTIRESGARIAAAELPTLPIAPAHLSQLLQNLIGNAVKYRRQDVPLEIQVGSRRDGPGWVLWVRDNGQGVPAEYRDRVFGLFRRLHSEDVPGTGLGLAICRRVAEYYGGRIWIEDGEKGSGATFCVALPDYTATR